jgi:hypothetical protein
MASGHVNRAQRPNTWLHRPACNVKYPLPTRSRPHMALRRPREMSAFWSLLEAERTSIWRRRKTESDPVQTADAALIVFEQFDDCVEPPA